MVGTFFSDLSLITTLLLVSGACVAASLALVALGRRLLAATDTQAEVQDAQGFRGRAMGLVVLAVAVMITLGMLAAGAGPSAWWSAGPLLYCVGALTLARAHRLEHAAHTGRTLTGQTAAAAPALRKAA